MAKKKKNKKTTQEISAAKKAAVLGTNKKSRLPIVLAICAALIIGGGVFIVQNQGSDTAFTIQAQPVPNPKTTMVSYPVDMFSDGKARHFEHKHANLTIRYFVLKSSDGIIRAAFDACDVCWPAGKGYYQDGDNMVCRNCGRRFASVLVNEVKGGCNPAPLTRSVEGNQLVLQVKDILEGKQFFDFSKRT